LRREIVSLWALTTRKRA